MQIPFELEGSKKNYREGLKVDLEHIILKIEPDMDERKIHGLEELYFRSLTFVQDFYIHAYEMNILNIEFADISADYEYDGKRILIKLKEKIEPNKRFKIKLEYETKPRKGVYFIQPDEYYPNKKYQIWTQGEDEDTRYWCPCIDIPEEKITAEIYIKVPKKFVAISNGRLVEVIEDKEYKIFHWKMDKPFAPYLLSFVVGEYEEIKEEYEGIPVIHYVPKDRIIDAKESYKETINILKFFSEKLDFKYPFDKYANVSVDDFIFGGMENVTATTLTSASILDEIARIDMTSTHLLAHEIAHSWFGDLITCKDWANIWLNEGFATYFDCLYTEFSQGWDEFIYYLLQRCSDTYHEDSEKRYIRAIVTRTYSMPIELFDSHSYQKGALVLHLLRYEVGEENFWEIMRRYVRKYKYSTVTTEDFRKTVEEVTGNSFEEFFDQWIYSAGHPILKINTEYDKGLVKITIQQEQKELFKLQLDVLFKFDNEIKIEKIHIFDKVQNFYFKVNKKPQFIDVDPYGWLLIAKITREDVNNLIEIAKNGITSISKIRAIRNLSKRYDPRVIKVLDEIIKNEKLWMIRAEAIKILATIKVEDSKRILITALNDENAKVRREAAKALGEFIDAKLLEVLKEYLKNKAKSYNEIGEALISLGKQKNKEAIAFIKEYLNFRSHEDIVKASAIRALGEFKDIELVNIFKKYASLGNHENVRIAAVECLGKLLKEKEEMFEDFLQYLKDRSFRVRITAIKALEELGDKRCIPFLEEVIQNDLDGRVIRRAKEAVYKIKKKIEEKTDVKSLKEELEKLKKENEELKSKIYELEKMLK